MNTNIICPNANIMIAETPLTASTKLSKKLSCCRETMWHCVTFNISLSY